jgi:hypothetical protein
MFRSGRTRPTRAQSSGSRTLLPIRSLAGYIIGTVESRFRKRQPAAIGAAHAGQPDRLSQTFMKTIANGRRPHMTMPDEITCSKCCESRGCTLACSGRLDEQALVGSQAQGRSDRFAATVAMCGDRDTSLGRCGGGPNLRISGKIEYDNYPIIAIAALIGEDIAFPRQKTPLPLGERFMFAPIVEQASHQEED